MSKTTATVSIVISTLIAASGIILIAETIQNNINTINLPIGLFLILVGVTAGLSVWNEYATQKDIQCVKNSTQSKTSSTDSTESNNNSNSEQ